MTTTLITRLPTSDEIAFAGSVRRCERLRRMRRGEIEPDKCDALLVNDPALLDDLICTTTENLRDLERRITRQNV